MDPLQLALEDQLRALGKVPRRLGPNMPGERAEALQRAAQRVLAGDVGAGGGVRGERDQRWMVCLECAGRRCRCRICGAGAWQGASKGEKGVAVHVGCNQ